MDRDKHNWLIRATNDQGKTIFIGWCYNQTMSVAQNIIGTIAKVFNDISELNLYCEHDSMVNSIIKKLEDYTDKDRIFLSFIRGYDESSQDI